MRATTLSVTIATVAFSALALTSLPAGAQSDSAAVARLGMRADSILLAAVPRGFNGVVRIEKNGAVVLFKGYGMANRERAIPFTPETVVQLGNVTKHLTLAALLRLQVKGVLRFTDSLTKYFPGTPADKRRITLEQLATHRAGLTTRLGADDQPIGRDEFTKRALETPLHVTPGAYANYSNAGYGLLAAVIEQVTAVSYDEAIRDAVLAPLDLENTGVLLPAFDSSRVAHGYINSVDQGTILTRPHAADGLWWNMRGSSGTLSTLGDVHTFFSALFTTDKLLTTVATKRYFDAAAPVKYVSLDRGTSFLYERVPKQRVEVIIASNSKESDALEVRGRLGGVIELLLEGAAKVAEAGVKPSKKRAPAKSSSRRKRHRWGRHHH